MRLEGPTHESAEPDNRINEPDDMITGPGDESVEV